MLQVVSNGVYDWLVRKLSVAAHSDEIVIDETANYVVCFDPLDGSSNGKVSELCPLQYLYHHLHFVLLPYPFSLQFYLPVDAGIPTGTIIGTYSH